MFFLILSFLIVPFQSIVVPLYKWITKFGLTDTYLELPCRCLSVPSVFS